jgi:hypothetical protein
VNDKGRYRQRSEPSPAALGGGRRSFVFCFADRGYVGVVPTEPGDPAGEAGAIPELHRHRVLSAARPAQMIRDRCYGVVHCLSLMPLRGEGVRYIYVSAERGILS